MSGHPATCSCYLTEGFCTPKSMMPDSGPCKLVHTQLWRAYSPPAPWLAHPCSAALCDCSCAPALLLYLPLPALQSSTGLQATTTTTTSPAGRASGTAMTTTRRRSVRRRTTTSTSRSRCGVVGRRWRCSRQLLVVQHRQAFARHACESTVEPVCCWNWRWDGATGLSAACTGKH